MTQTKQKSRVRAILENYHEMQRLSETGDDDALLAVFEADRYFISARLTQRERNALYLRYKLGWTLSDMAKRYGISWQAVRQTLENAITKLEAVK